MSMPTIEELKKEPTYLHKIDRVQEAAIDEIRGMFEELRSITKFQEDLLLTYAKEYEDNATEARLDQIKSVVSKHFSRYFEYLNNLDRMNSVLSEYLPDVEEQKQTPRCHKASLEDVVKHADCGCFEITQNEKGDA